MGKNKHIKGTTGKNNREAKSRRDPSEDCFPVWIFTKVDVSGKFAFDVSRHDFDSRYVLGKIIEYSRMKWSEIRRHTHGEKNKSKHHFLEYGSLSSEAMERIDAKHLHDDTDAIFSFAFGGKVRVIGIRKDEKFYPVWYDPNHEFCPSSKKNT